MSISTDLINTDPEDEIDVESSLEPLIEEALSLIQETLDDLSESGQDIDEIIKRLNKLVKKLEHAQSRQAEVNLSLSKRTPLNLKEDEVNEDEVQKKEMKMYRMISWILDKIGGRNGTSIN